MTVLAKEFLRWGLFLAFLAVVFLFLTACNRGDSQPQTYQGPIAVPPEDIEEEGSYPGARAYPEPRPVQPVEPGSGTPVAVAEEGEDGQLRAPKLLPYQGERSVDGYEIASGHKVIRSDDIATQTALMAQGLPVEPWYVEIIPNLFSADPEEVRSGLMMYGVQLKAWEKTLVTIGSFSVTGTIITEEGVDGSTLRIETPTITTPEIRFATYPPPKPPKFLNGLQKLGIGGSEILAGLISFFAYDSFKTNAETQQSIADSAGGNFEAGAEAAIGGVEAGSAATEGGANLILQTE